MPDPIPGEVPFSEAIDFFQAKLSLPSKSWDEMVGAIHAKGFTVAGATKIALLDDLRGAVNAAIESGETIGDFRARFDAIVQQHGWSHKGTPGWRSRVIYDTNLRTARMAGRWQQYQRVKDRRPYLQYQTAGDARVRPEHAAWDNTVLPIDSPWWDTHYPPNGWGCRCTTRSLSQRQMEREGLAVAPEPTVERTERVNPDTGEVFPPTPVGIDTGWDYNVGKAWLGPDQALAERVMRLPKPWRDRALRQATQVAADSTPSFGAWAERVLSDTASRGELRTAGWLTGDIIDGLSAAGVTVDTPLITVRDVELRRMQRDTKAMIGKRQPADATLSLPEHLAAPQSVLLDRQILRERGMPMLLYVFDVGGPVSRGKFVVRVGFRAKGEAYNSVRSGDITPTINLRDPSQYIVLAGKV